KLVINNRVGCNMSMFDIRRCSDITLRHITVYACACTGVVGSQMAGPVTIDDFNMTYRPNSNLWITSTADGVHMQGGPGVITLINSSFIGLLDDGLNLYQWRSLVDEVLADNKIVLNTDGGAMPIVGDTMEFFDSVNQRLLGVSRIVEITDTTGEGPHQRGTLTLENPIAGMCGKEADVPTQGYLQRHEFAGSVVRNNVFKNLRGRGLVLHTTDTVIENNRFENISNHGIHGWYGYQEGLRIRNMTITGNTFENVGYYRIEAHQGPAGAISIRLDNSEATVQSEQKTFHEDIVIRNNTFTNFHACAINVGNIKGVTIADNTLQSDVEKVRYNGERGIQVTYCEDAKVSGNRLSNALGDVWKPLVMREVDGATVCENQYCAKDVKLVF
ncbi:MAG: right-handed parallel beta-helix repeat-containing protein, partial [Clostridia bacterium]|nr:right-handed parallel beta-helix repeat-containing protein [Clostridia bacterium]